MLNNKEAVVIAIVNIKGGVGKSTLAIHLATEMAALGHQTLLMDTDRQETTRFWHRWRAENHENRVLPDLMTPLENWTPGSYNKLIIDKINDYSFIIIDTAGFENGIMEEAMLSSDMILMPTMVSQAEILSTATTINKAKEHGLKPYIVWSRIPPTTNQSKRMKECLELLDVPALETVIYQRQVYLDALELGMVVSEIEKDETQPSHKRKGAGQASVEITSLAKELITIRIKNYRG